MSQVAQTIFSRNQRQRSPRNLAGPSNRQITSSRRSPSPRRETSRYKFSEPTVHHLVFDTKHIQKYGLQIPKEIEKIHIDYTFSPNQESKNNVSLRFQLIYDVVNEIIVNRDKSLDKLSRIASNILYNGEYPFLESIDIKLTRKDDDESRMSLYNEILKSYSVSHKSVKY